jgi:hypothetical protein
MIVDRNGNKLTPKQAAQEIILDAISSSAGYWEEGLDSGTTDLEGERLTRREVDSINDQLGKQFERVQKLFNQSGWRLG